MPTFDYRCGACQGITPVLSYSWSKPGSPACRHCGGPELTKLITGFSFHRIWGDSLNWTPSGETLSDVNEDDPRDIDRFMGRIKEEMGGQVTPDFNDMRREIIGDS